MNIRVALLIAAGALVVLGGCRKKQPAVGAQLNGLSSSSMGGDGSPNKMDLPKAAILEGLTYVKGAPVKFEDGKVYVVEFWATWCPPCKDSIPHLTQVQKQFKDKGVTILGVSNESLDTVRTFVNQMGTNMDYTVAVDVMGKVDSGYMGAFGQDGIPTAFIVDSKGRVAWLGHPMAGLEDALEKVIANGGI